MPPLPARCAAAGGPVPASGRLGARPAAGALLRPAPALAAAPRLAPAARRRPTRPGAAGGSEDDDLMADDPFGPADESVVIPPEFLGPSTSGGAADDSEGGAALAAAVSAAAAEFVGGVGGDGEDDHFGEQVRVFPRIKERDPYRRLGVGRDASFEEVQDARNYLFETYKRHERSREAVELAFDAILKEKMKERQALGFRPPRARGARGGRPGRPTPKKERRSFSGTAFGAAFLDRFGNWIDPSASVITLINDGTIFAVFGLWAAWQRDPTFPLLATICYAAWKLYDKRKKASPDGPFVGGSPVFGAAAGTVVALLLGLATSVGVVKVCPALPGVRPAAVGLFALNAVVGLVSIYLR